MPIFTHFGAPAVRRGRLPPGARICERSRPVRPDKLPRRRRLRLPVRVLTTSGAHWATVTGLSLYGACLEGGRKLRRREILALQLPSGKRVNARVRWRLGTRCGVTLMTPVADFARLLSEALVICPSVRYRHPAFDRSRRQRPSAQGVPLAKGGIAPPRRVFVAVLMFCKWVLLGPAPTGDADVPSSTPARPTLVEIGALPPQP